MSEQSEKRIKAALYTAVMQKLNGELAELEAKEILLVNNPTYITSKDFDHADHIEELKNIIMEKVDIREALKDVKSLFSQSQVPPPSEADGKNKKNS
jgi:hypothetical protein|tara:strand:- start:9 stop:299 length:291 start_codon:yes stop_codon:yes gene_type:complete